MKEKHLNIVLLEDISFDELIPKLEKLFDHSLLYKNEKGRLIARCNTDDFKLEVIDKYDDLDESLCDDHYTIKFTITHTMPLDYEETENKIKEKFKNNIKWEYAIWSPVEKGEPYRRIYPEKETELFYRN